MFASKMYGVCLRYAKDTTEAEDILQDGFIKVFQHMGSFKHEGSFEGWVRRIMVNTALERFRKKNPLITVSEVYPIAKNMKYDDIESNMSAAELMQLVQKLSPGYRTVFNLYAIEGYSHQEIADMLGISEGTSKSQLARARAVLQEEVMKLYNPIQKKIVS
ncbi:MAG: sigma-70 family RNA polymerase sigma factor [Candidatus Competibacteraceae bacterium]|nr:sigma-70 family RNA polymerase sigma factor [Candidatus Competibacteraceae bacterium]